MKIRHLIIVFVLLAGTFSCKTEFEKIRASGEADKIYNKAFELYDNGEYMKAQILFEQILSAYRGKAQAEQLYFRYAFTHYYLRNYVSAAFYFKNFTSTFATSPLREEADYMAAISNYRLSPVFRLEQSHTIQAIDDFQNFINQYPRSPKVEECNDYIDELRAKLERKAHAEGRLYFDLKQYQAAIQSLENLLKDFPESENAESIRFLILQASYELAENSIYERQEERYNQVIEKYTNFKNKYPRSGMLKEASAIRNRAYEKLKQFSYVGHKD